MPDRVNATGHDWHDWRDWESCGCGERGCKSYRPFFALSNPSTFDLFLVEGC